MNLLFDQNISFRIIKKLHEVFPDCEQDTNLGLTNLPDIDIWEYARVNNYCIVTFDSDFIDISSLKGFPPKIIWLRLGNTSTEEVSQRIRNASERINLFLDNKAIGFLKIS